MSKKQNLRDQIFTGPVQTIEVEVIRDIPLTESAWAGNKEPEMVRLVAPPNDRPRPPRYVFRDGKPASTQKPLTSVDLLNARLDATIKVIEFEEWLYPEGDPIREELAAARRRLATRFEVSRPAEASIKVVK